ncbi:MAG: MFS transporter [Chloroflexota bacterium]|nr:MFS transporter [Chloroflexota bacterium]
MDRSLVAVLVATFTLRFSTGLTGTMLVYFLAEPEHGRLEVGALVVGIFAALFYLAELFLSPLFGLLSDRQGFHRVMQYGPLFGAVAVIITGFVPAMISEGQDADLGVLTVGLVTVGLVVIALTRVLEGASTAASVPSILGYIAQATADDEGLRGRVAARFELATIVGIGVGIGAAGPIWQMWDFVGLPRPFGFFLNGAFYLVSLAIFRWGVVAPERPAGPHHHPMYGVARYWKLVTTSHVWLLAPTWIAVNAALGLYATQSLFALVRTPDARFADQLLAGGIDPLQVTAGLVAAGVVFIAGILYWGNRFKDMRRTTIIFYGIIGGAVVVAAALALNYSRDLDGLLRLLLLVPLAGGLFVLAGATPAALGLLADISESYPDDRGAIMGLYSVFLAVGQILGALIGGAASEWMALTGILLATLVLLAIALLPLWHLRAYEHRFVPGPGGPQPPLPENV